MQWKEGVMYVQLSIVKVHDPALCGFTKGFKFPEKSVT